MSGPDSGRKDRTSGEDGTHNGTHKKETLSVVLMVKNEEARLAHCLDQIKGWADEIVVVDDLSEDATSKIAQQYTDKVFKHPSNDNHDQQWNYGIDRAASDWILHIDADEIVPAALKTAIDQALTHSQDVSAFEIIRKNIFLGHPMQFGGWRHRHKILFRREKCRCIGQGIHVKLQVEGPTEFLDAEIEHYPFDSFSQFIDRQNHYSSIEAGVLYQAQPNLPWKKVLFQLTLRPFKLFWKSYVKNKGHREGPVGFFFSALFSVFHMILWAKYWELAQNSTHRSNHV